MPFLIYINDLYYAIKASCPLHFADDTCLLNIQSSIKEINRTLNKHLKQLALWLNANKYHQMLQKQKLFYLNLKINNWTLISDSNYVENNCIPLPKLGIWVFWLMINLTGMLILIILFQNLWARSNSISSKLIYYVNKEILRTIYFSIFHPYLTYVTTVWRQQEFEPFNSNSSSYFHDYILKFVI